MAAERLPVARVAVDVPLPHLDRLFDYLVPEQLAEQAVPGCRVRVRFAGRLTGGYLLERAEASEHEGRLAFLERVLSPEPVLTAGNRRTCPRRGRPVWRNARRCAAAGYPAAARERRSRDTGRGAGPSTLAGPGRAEGPPGPGTGSGLMRQQVPGRAIRPERHSSPRSRTAAVPARRMVSPAGSGLARGDRPRGGGDGGERPRRARRRA